LTLQVFFRFTDIVINFDIKNYSVKKIYLALEIVNKLK